MRALVARDIMNPDVITVRDDTSVVDLAEFLIDHQISGAPVEDAEGRLIGVVSLTDVAGELAGRDQTVLDHPQPAYYLRTWQESFNPEDLAGLRVAAANSTVGEIMTPSIFAVDEEMPIWKIAEKMIHSHIHRLLVTRDRKVVGILTTTDLLGLLVDAPDAPS